MIVLTLLLAAGSVGFAAPRALPPQQAAHFCQLLVSQDEGNVYPLSIYARHLTMLLCGAPEYEGFTAEQVLTGLIFYYDDWQSEPLVAGAFGERRLLIQELRSGRTLRIFPHTAAGGRTEWYAPTDSIPQGVGQEHRRYMREVLPRLQAEVLAGRWKEADAYIDRMIDYQCTFGSGSQKSAGQSPALWWILLPFAGLIVLAMAAGRRRRG